ncbi:hypothetical protein F2Q69_00049928 [Brassica cretica]|uniref:Protein kinase domain-containing protein n=1 Tax=Brassica cretica TaxID=69181 RepID=A0A8S9PPK8_BRACR|nr:hypothetical protein F2Q69_00049928 [Brassica cretica]
MIHPRPAAFLASFQAASDLTTKLLSYGSDRMPYGKVRIKNPIISKGCSSNEQESTSLLNLTGSPFYVSDSNTLVAIGCNNKASLTNIEPSIVGCFSSCLPTNHTTSKDYLETVNCNSKSRYDDDGYGYCSERSYINETSCNGNRCCKASMPGSIQQVVGVRIDDNTTTRGGCKVAFLTYDQAYSLLHGSDPNLVLAKRYSTVEFGWFIHTTDLLSFVDSLKCMPMKEYINLSLRSYEGTSGISCACDYNSYFPNYTSCRCNRGYKGNPYIPGGCKGFGSSFGSLILIGGIYGLYRFIRKQKRLNQKKKFFKRNGGLLLQQQLTSAEGSVDKTRVFSSRELEKATENFSLTRILGQGGQGTVYKGMLVDGRIVAVKKSKVVDEDKLEEFINEVVILSQINHRNIVKLLGCCLETDVPVLVYEFIPNGNLFEHLHEDESDDHTMTTWEVRLRIAIDIAGALSYLHSAASSPIYHRDVKSTNIMLDEKYRAKVSDFGTSRTVTVDHTHLTTVVSGTVGYLDPEYFQSSQFTDKSDVYSFGVVLALFHGLCSSIQRILNANVEESTSRTHFGIGKGCYLNKWYEIKCDHNNSFSVSGKPVPVLSIPGKEVVNISLPSHVHSDYPIRMTYGAVRIKYQITSRGCSSNEQEPTSLLDLMGSPFYVSDSNTMIAIGCNNRASLTNMEPSIVGCFSSCLSTNHIASNDYLDTVNCYSKSDSDDAYENCSERRYINETSCNGNRCCKASMPSSDQQVVGVRIDDNSAATRGCKVAFLTDEAYSLLDGTDPKLLLDKRYSTVELQWFIDTTNLSFVDSLRCITMKEYQPISRQYSHGMNNYASCACDFNSSVPNYASCSCNIGYRGNPYILGGCKG